MIVLVTDGLLDMGMSVLLHFLVDILTRTVVEHPLATGISVLRGTAQVVVPKVAPGKNYQILGEYRLLGITMTPADVCLTVFGDSGNTGEFFEIVN